MTLDLDAHPDVLLIRKHLVEHLGPPRAVVEVRGSPLPSSPVQALNIAYFAPQGPEAPVVFVTCGASLYTMRDGRRVEAMVLLRREPPPDGFEAVHRLLGAFALFAETHREVVRVGDVVRANDELRQLSSMDAVLFMPPVPFVPAFHRVALGGERTSELIWLLPVYESEAAYALSHGPQALMMLFAAQSLDLTDMHRDEANTLMEPADAELQARKALAKNQAATADQAATPLPVGKTKSDRRDVGRGSFEVAELGNTVRVSRRSRGDGTETAARAEAARTEAVVPATPTPRPDAPKIAPERPATAQPPERRGPPPPRRPERRPAPPLERAPEVRFDLEGGRAQSAPAPRRAPPPPPKPAPSPPETAEAKAAAKKKRIEELKANARAAAERAAERAAARATAGTQPAKAGTALGATRPPANPGTPPKAEPRPRPQGAVQLDAARAAAKRRGAPVKAIGRRLEQDDDEG